MTYRSEEQARRAQIDDLSRDLVEARQEVETLRKKLARAEEKAAVFRRLAERAPEGDAETRWRLARWLFAAGLIPGALAWSGGVLLAMLDSDQMAWGLVNLALALGIIGPVPAWFRAGHPFIGMVAMAGKLVLWIQLGRGWWTLSYESLRAASNSDATNFFWVLPPAILLIGFVEALTARWTVHHDQRA